VTITADYETAEDRPVRPVDPDTTRVTEHGHAKPAWLFLTPFLLLPPTAVFLRKPRPGEEDRRF